VEVTFRTSKLQKCYEEQASTQRAWGEAIARAYARRIEILKACATVQDVRSFRHLRLHALKRAYQGKHALDLHDRWRLIVTFEEGPPARVQIEEVSPHYGD
jgi:proteic killer suppression protein